jgi:primase-polymerase (primpol)-like protein
VITETTGVISPIVQNIPVWLSARPQWILWRVEARGDALAKIPHAVETGTRVDATDILGWSSFEDAVEAYTSSDGFYSGLGFCLASCDPFVAADLDRCRDVQTGEIAPWARKLIERVPRAYLEVSASGTGLHLILEAKLPAGGMRRGRLELYSRDRFIALTGVLP